MHTILPSPLSFARQALERPFVDIETLLPIILPPKVERKPLEKFEVVFSHILDICIDPLFVQVIAFEPSEDVIIFDKSTFALPPLTNIAEFTP